MQKLMDIKGYWDFSGNYSFVDSRMWEGKILLDENGWFEGIANDPHLEYTGDKFIFGIYHPEKVIELIKVSPEEISDPFIFRGKRDVKGYDGKLSILRMFGEQRCGVCHIITQYAEDRKQDINELDLESEKEELLKRIEAFKENDDYWKLYNNTYAIREQLSEITLRNYEGKTFSNEESEILIKGTKNITDDVEKNIMDNVKQYVKKLNDSLPPVDAENK